MEAPGLVDLLALARRLALEASALQQEALGHARAGVETKSTATDVVTATDRASERLIVDGIRAARPDDGILGEEGTLDPGTSGVRWVVDPLDGTTNFLYGVPAFGPAIGVEVDGEVVVGVVADTGRGELFEATKGGGAFLDGRPITVGTGTDLATALVGTGFGYDPGRRATQADVLRRVLPKVRDIRRFGAAALDLCWVACGRFDAYYERGLAPWDLAAGGLIAAEAGATLGDLRGGPPSGELVIAANAALFEPLRALLDAAGAAAD